MEAFRLLVTGESRRWITRSIISTYIITLETRAEQVLREWAEVEVERGRERQRERKRECEEEGKVLKKVWNTAK